MNRRFQQYAAAVREEAAAEDWVAADQDAGFSELIPPTIPNRKAIRDLLRRSPRHVRKAIFGTWRHA